MKNEDIHKRALKRYDGAVVKDLDNREDALDDLRFLANRSWPEETRREREADGKPCLSINRLSRFVRQVTGDIRRTNPGIKVVPADGDASEEMAEIKGGLIRQIEAASGAEGVYEGAAESAASCGMGNFRVLTEYAADEGDEQEIRLELLPNPFAVYWDPLSKDPTRRDARFCFVTEVMDLEDFEEQFPDAKTEGFDESGGIDVVKHWFHGERITVAEYFWKETAKGRAPKVMWAKMTGCEIIDGPREWPGRHIPVVAVTGEELHLGDEVVRSSVIRYAKDSQVAYNFMRSAQVETIGLQPKAPFLLTSKQVQTHEAMWARANVASVPYLVYNPDPAAPPPERSQPPLASTALAEEIRVADEEMKATTGIYDASLGARSNEQSGVAIRARQMEGDVSTSIYVDNLKKAIEQTGRIILDLMPKIYDTQRVIRILGKEGEEKLVAINAVVQTMGGPMELNSMLAGTYDVRVTTGPSYTTMRQESADGMLQLAQTLGPQAALAFSDLLVKNLDWPGAEQIAERLAKLVPPGVAEKSPQEMSPQEQQAFAAQQQMQQQMQAMQQAMQQLQIRMAAAEAADKEAAAALKQADVAKTVAETAQIRAETGMSIEDRQVDRVLRVDAHNQGAARTAAEVENRQAATWRARNEPFRVPAQGNSSGGDRLP